MTIKEKKQFLAKYRLQQLEINRLTEMIKTFPDENEKYKKELLKARQLRDRIESEIEAVDDDILVEILSQKYMCGRTLTDIAVLMNYSIRHIERLHKKALSLVLE